MSTTDLIIRRQDGAGAAFIVKETGARRFFRWGEAEHFIARQLDGATPLETIRRRVEERFGGVLSPDALAGFVAKLRSLSLLEDDRDSQRAEPPAARVRGNFLYLRFAALDPDRLLERLEGRLRFCFGPLPLAASALVVLAGASIMRTSAGPISRELAALHVEHLLLAWLVLLAVTVVHEFAHGVTCKHFGGEVREMGLMLLYFQPAMYCNVSDAWLFPKRSQRLWVTFAGAWVELVILATAALAWRIFESNTLVSSVALVGRAR